MKKLTRRTYVTLISLLAVGCSSDTPVFSSLFDGDVLNDDFMVQTSSERLKLVIEQQLGVEGLDSLILPESQNYSAIPQDVNNEITEQKVVLGKMLFHDTAFALDGRSPELKTWSCASCHHSAAGFKSGIPQGIGEGGRGFGNNGSERLLAVGFDGNAPTDAANLPDIQPVASPAVLNVAYQGVMLWNGQFGNEQAGSVNSGLSLDILSTDGTPRKENRRELSGIETQAIAGLGVHRIRVDHDTPLQTNYTYQLMWSEAFGTDATSGDVIGNAGKAIAAFERTVLSNRAPFQLWLRGDEMAMSDTELRGAELFFGKAGCGGCHQGPALSSKIGASEEEMFFAIGFRDFDTGNSRIHGSVTEAISKGRGGFTRNSNHDYKFKIPQLYNLADSSVFGHGASFSSIRDVIEYKNRANPQSEAARINLDWRFTPLGLSEAELHDLEIFLTVSLYDPDLERYQPEVVPSGECLIVDPLQLDSEGLCPDP